MIFHKVMIILAGAVMLTSAGVLYGSHDKKQIPTATVLWLLAVGLLMGLCL